MNLWCNTHYMERDEATGLCRSCAIAEIERLRAEADDQFARQQQVIGRVCKERDAAEDRLREVVDALEVIAGKRQGNGIQRIQSHQEIARDALAAAQPSRIICDTHHTGGGAYYKDECPSCLAAAQPEEEHHSDYPYNHPDCCEPAQPEEGK